MWDITTDVNGYYIGMDTQAGGLFVVVRISTGDVSIYLADIGHPPCTKGSR